MTLKLRSAVVLASVVAAGASAPTMAADWPSFRGPRHDGISTEAVTWPKNGPKQLSKINVGIGHSAVSVQHQGRRGGRGSQRQVSTGVLRVTAAGFGGNPPPW